MFDFSPYVFWEYSKLLLVCAAVGVLFGFVYTHVEQKMMDRNEVQKNFRGFLSQLVLICLFCTAFSLIPAWGKVSLGVFLFAALTLFVAFMVMPWTASMMVEWKYIPPWELLKPSYYKKRRSEDEV
jgi:uncharacterized membrane protein